MTELTPVVTQSQFNPLIFWPLLVIVGLVIGLIYWHRKNPSAEAKALKEASAGAKVTIEHITEVLHDVREALVGKNEAPAETLEQMAGGTLPAGWTVHPPVSTYDPAAILAARKYRVAVMTLGPDDPRTIPYLTSLVSFAHWSDVLEYAGREGYDAAIEQELTLHA